MKKLISLVLVFTFLFAGAGFALAEGTSTTTNPNLNTNVDKKIKLQEKRDQLKQKKAEIKDFKTAYQYLKELRGQLVQLRKDYNSKKKELRTEIRTARQNKDKDKLQKAIADLKGIKELTKDRINGFKIGQQEIQDLKQARQNKDFLAAKAIVEVMEKNLQNRIDLLTQVNAKLDLAIADLK